MDNSKTAGSAEAWGLLQESNIVMKKKILSLHEHYDLEDLNGKKIGEGDGNFFQVPAKFKVISLTGSDGGASHDVLHIDGKLISLRHEFDFVDPAGNKKLGNMKKKIAKLVGQEYWVEQDGKEIMRIYGNFVQHDYAMAVNGQQVAQVHKNWVSVRDQFGVSITGEVDHRLVIGVVIVVEHVEVSEREH